MTSHPDARRQEFYRPLELAGLRNGEVLVDFPSGGGYLEPYIDEVAKDVTYHPLEHVPGYRVDHRKMNLQEWTALPLPAASCDVFFNLAALHHYLEDRGPFFAECHRVLRPAGRLIIGDVMAGTPAAAFLDEVVRRYSSQGHTARFIAPDPDQLRKELGQWFSLEYFQCEDLYWRFPDTESLVAFCRDLFRLDLIDDSLLAQLLSRYLGIEAGPDGAKLRWQLVLIRADRLAST
jgi:SAM-dependent methyltransferase